MEKVRSSRKLKNFFTTKYINTIFTIYILTKMNLYAILDKIYAFCDLESCIISLGIHISHPKHGYNACN